MYVALRETFDVYPGGKAVRRYAGDVLETFHTWPVQNQMAALNARCVREVPEGGLTPRETFVRQSAGDIRDAKERARHAAGIAAEAESMKPTSAMLTEPIEKLSPEPDGIEMVEGHACTECNYVGTTARGLAIHRGTAHKQ